MKKTTSTLALAYTLVLSSLLSMPQASAKSFKGNKHRSSQPVAEMQANAQIPNTKALKPTPNLSIKTIQPHTAIYAMTFGGFDVGHIRYQLTQVKNNHYQYKVDSDLGFLLLSDKRQIISEFILDSEKFTLTPISFYQNRKGTGGDFIETVTFDPKNQEAKSLFKKKGKALTLKQQTLDPLSAQVQMRLDFLGQKESFKYHYVLGNKVEDVSFSLVGTESIAFDNHKMLATKVEVKRKSKKRKTYLWFTEQLGYIPFKIEDSRKGKEAIIAQLIYYEQETSGGNIIFGKKVPLRTIHEKPKSKKKKHHRR
ncbi:MAG: DUF3108 domain-containing protein [Cellvibrionales bacterium]|nr:DUF3108 domain-containing protein [Cellvibrionales bacterium]